MAEKLLTIAIPTWNREAIIMKSLSFLLPQVNDLKSDIQLIVSDNASDDATVSVVNQLLQDYPEIDAIFFKQAENTGYYGNFRKCRELSSGKYFWLLSDNEVILNERLKYIVAELKQAADEGIIYLYNIPGSPLIESRALSFDELFDSRNYKLTFISACIMLNIKEQDDRIFQEFYGNSFLGYALLLNTRKYSDKAMEITGEIYQSIPAVVSFNVFKSWTSDIFQCFAFIEKEGLFSKAAVERMKESILICVLKDHIHHYRLYNSYYGKSLGTFTENYSLLNSYYGHIKSFKDIIAIKETSRLRLQYYFYKKKIGRYLRKRIKFS